MDQDVTVPAALVRKPEDFGGVKKGDLIFGHPVWRNDRLEALTAPKGTADTIMVLPKLAEPHCHLDKCHTIARLGPVGGDLMAAISAQAEDKAQWTSEDLQSRASRGADEARRAGCALIRSHIDWGDTAAPPHSWNVLTQYSDPDIQWAALTGIDQMADPAFAKTVARAVAERHGVLGAFVLHHDKADIASGLAHCFALAETYGLMLDFHVDEGLGGYNGLEMIADAALAARYEGPVLCGHAVSLMDKTPDEFKRIAEKLARANISICALPTTNLYLQGRRDGTPDRRGITKLRELHSAGVRIVTGSDNVGDAFCPTGQHDPMAALHLASLTAHLDPPLDQWLPMITTDAMIALGQSPVFVDGARSDALLMSTSQSTADLIAGRAPLLPISTEGVTK